MGGQAVGTRCAAAACSSVSERIARDEPSAQPRPALRTAVIRDQTEQEPKTQTATRPRRRRRTARSSTCPMRRSRGCIKTAKTRGYVTYDELNAVLPSEEVSSEQIEDTMSMLSDMGITVVESEEGRGAAPPKPPRTPPTTRRSSPRRHRAEPARHDRPRAPSRPSAPTIPCACICARWARSSCCRARARSPSPSASRPAARP